MFVTPNHHGHNEMWLFPSPGEKSSYQCLACLVGVLEDTLVSRVQREVAFGVLKSMIEYKDAVTKALATNITMCVGLNNIIFDNYSKDPFKKTAVSLCTSLIHKLQNETLFQAFMDRLNNIIHGNMSDVDLQFYLAVLHQLCERSADNAKMLYLYGNNILGNIIKNRTCLEQETLTELVCVLKHLVKVMLQALPSPGHAENLLLQGVMDALLSWLGMSFAKDFHGSCLALLLECMESPSLAIALLLKGENSVLLMGLKRLLATKDETLILMGTKCLTRLMEGISEPWHVKIVLDTDVAEFVFEFLHTSNVYQLTCVFQCLHTMARQQLFFDKCQAVYGLETTVLALQTALDTKKYTVVEKGFAFLTCLLDRQPENMPLFLNQSWWACSKLVLDTLRQESQPLVFTALLAAEAFLRPKHQQSPVDVKTITQLLKTVVTSTQNQLNESPRQAAVEDIHFGTLKCLFAVAASIHDLLLSDNILCGNEDSALNDLQQTTKSFCISFLLPWTIDHWSLLRDSDTVKDYFILLDMAINMTENDEELMTVVPMNQLHQGLILVSQSYVSKDAQHIGQQVLISVLNKYAEQVKPSLPINTQRVIAGSSKLLWHHTPCLDHFVEKIRNAEERAAVFAFLYLSMLNGHSISDCASLLHFLKVVICEFPGILSEEAFVVRGFVYILAVCQANIYENADSIVFDRSGVDIVSALEKLPVEGWYTAGLAVFSWAMLASEKSEALGRQMVEYWLVHLDVGCAQPAGNLTGWTNHDMSIISSIVASRKALLCLMDFLESAPVRTKAKAVLEFSINALLESRTMEMAPSILETLLASGIQRLDILLIQSTSVDCDLVSTLLQVLCQLLEPPAGSCFSRPQTPSFKSVYNVVKLIEKCLDQESVVAPALQYFANIVRGLSAQESKAVIPVLLQSDKCSSFLENLLEDPSGEMYYHGLVTVVWLATHGQLYEAENYVTIRSQLLLWHLASCRHQNSLPIMQLLRSALLAMAERRTMFGACRFHKASRAFVPTKIFSHMELRQIFGYLQQFVSMDNLGLRLEAISCIETLLRISQDMGPLVMHSPWNSVMLESFLSRAQNGLHESDLTLCHVFSGRSQILSQASANSFLQGLLNSSLSQQQLEKAATLVWEIKQSQVKVDSSLMEAVEACFQDSE